MHKVVTPHVCSNHLAFGSWQGPMKAWSPEWPLLGAILVTWQDDKLDQLLVTGWNFGLVAVTFDFYFSGCFYCTSSLLGRGFQEPHSTWSSDCMLFNSQLADHGVIVPLDDRMLRNVPGLMDQRHQLGCWAQVHIYFCGWKAFEQNRRRQWVTVGTKHRLRMVGMNSLGRSPTWAGGSF